LFCACWRFLHEMTTVTYFFIYMTLTMPTRLPFKHDITLPANASTRCPFLHSGVDILLLLPHILNLNHKYKESETNQIQSICNKQIEKQRQPSGSKLRSRSACCGCVSSRSNTGSTPSPRGVTCFVRLPDYGSNQAHSNIQADTQPNHLSSPEHHRDRQPHAVRR
jgi:hypothetical protein